MRFVSLEQVYAIHDAVIANHGGAAGVRAPGDLESAVRAAEMRFYYDVAADHACLAAVLLERLIQNHAFVDGNKRTAVAAMLVYLDLNDHPPIGEDEQAELEEMAVAIATRAATMTDAADLIRRWA